MKDLTTSYEWWPSSGLKLLWIIFRISFTFSYWGPLFVPYSILMASSRNEVLDKRKHYFTKHTKESHTHSYTHRAVVKMTLLLNNTPLQSGSVPFLCIIYGTTFWEFSFPHISATRLHVWWFHFVFSCWLNNRLYMELLTDLLNFVQQKSLQLVKMFLQPPHILKRNKSRLEDI